MFTVKICYIIIIPWILCKDRDWLRADHMHILEFAIVIYRGSIDYTGCLLTEMTQTGQ